MSNVTIVMYHYVRDLKHSRHPRINGLTIDSFRAQLQYISKYYKVIKMQDLFSDLNGNMALPNNSLLLTFDDAYCDHFETVFPILDSMGMQGSFFPPAKAIQENKVLDVNKIHFILASVEDKDLLIGGIFSLLDEYRGEYNLRSNESYYGDLAEKGRLDSKETVFIKKLLQKSLPEKLRNIIINDLFFKYVSKDEAVFARELYMNADQVKYMYNHGMYIGSHGWDHCWLDNLSAQQQENEIKLSLKFLAGLGCSTNEWAMCYPYGSYNDSLIAILKSYGCKLGLTTKFGIANLTADNPFTFPRLDANHLPKDKDAQPNEWTSKVICN